MTGLEKLVEWFKENEKFTMTSEEMSMFNSCYAKARSLLSEEKAKAPAKCVSGHDGGCPWYIPGSNPPSRHAAEKATGTAGYRAKILEDQAIYDKWFLELEDIGNSVVQTSPNLGFRLRTAVGVIRNEIDLIKKYSRHEAEEPLEELAKRKGYQYHATISTLKLSDPSDSMGFKTEKAARAYLNGLADKKENI